MRYTLILGLLLFTNCGIAEKTGKAFDGDDKIEVQAEKGDTGRNADQPRDGKDGKDGKDSLPCKVTSSDKGHTITCGEQRVYLANGSPGETCSITPDDTGYTITCGDNSAYVNTTRLPGPRGNRGEVGEAGAAGSNGRDGRDAEPCELAETDTGYTITCNGKTIEVDTTPAQNEPVEIKICIWNTWYSIKTILAKLEDINNEVYDIAHIGQCLFEGKVADNKN